MTSIDNRPGLAAVSYRAGTWADFKAAMLNALSTAPELAGLRTRSDDDVTIALLDAWAMVCDILTFYQERIANEAYLRTSGELVSVGELAKLIGYKLRPGLAASVPLSFLMESPPPAPPGPSNPATGAPSAVVLAVGTTAQTVPDPGSQPATFETTAPITARAEWNAIAPRLRAPAAATTLNASANVRLRTDGAPPRTGDLLLVRSGGISLLQRVKQVDLDPPSQTVLVHLEADKEQVLAAPPTATGAVPTASVALDEDFLWGFVKDHVWADHAPLLAYAAAQGWSVDALETGINGLRGSSSPHHDQPVRASALGIHASVFGHNSAPDNPPDDLFGYTFNTSGGSGSGYARASISDTVPLDNVYPVAVGQTVVLRDGVSGRTFITDISKVEVMSLSRYKMSGKVTLISLASIPSVAHGLTYGHARSGPADFGGRTTQVLIETAELPVAEAFVHDDVSGNTLTLDGAYLHLTLGQLLAVTGVRADKRDETSSEVVTITGLGLVDGYTTVSFTPELTATYTGSTVTVDANVAPATHGQTTSEILGSGDGRAVYQRFPLKQPPLTYVSAATPTGAASTLVVRVDGVAWTEVPWLYGHGPTSQVYTVLPGADGRTYVQFGDGVTGARPGSGNNNIRATYRYGLGSSGAARPGQVSVLLSRPLGLKAVTNPVATTGATDPELIEQARRNAPTTVRTMDRIVSLEDVADFAAASAGIAKASVSWIWDGARYVACVTVAGVDGAVVAPGTPQYANLVQAMLAAADGTLAITVCSHIRATFRLAATVTCDPRLVAADVLAAVKQQLTTTFSFASRAFGQPVFPSEVISCIQSVPGVVAMTLDELARSDAWSRFELRSYRHPVSRWGSPEETALPAAPATLGSHGLVGAELLTLQPESLTKVVTA